MDIYKLSLFRRNKVWRVLKLSSNQKTYVPDDKWQKLCALKYLQFSLFRSNARILQALDLFSEFGIGAEYVL